MMDNLYGHFRNNQSSNQTTPGAKGYTVRIFLTPKQEKRLQEAVELRKELLHKEATVFSNMRLPNTDGRGVLFDAFSYMPNEYLEHLIEAYIGRTQSELEDFPK